MTRRGFLKALSIAAAIVSVPAALWHGETPTRLFDGPIYFKGHRLVFDDMCPKNTVYYINPNYLSVNRFDGHGWVSPLDGVSL